jgi:hypothetical protein
MNGAGWRRAFGTLFGLLLLGLCGQAGAEDILPNGGFKASRIGGPFPGAGWQLAYNMAVTGGFVAGDAPGVPQPVMTARNPVADKKLTVKSTLATIPESGTYRATIWAKAGADARALKGSAIEMVMFVLRSDYKGGNRKTARLRNGWLKYELEVKLAPSEVGKKYFFRIDIAGTGTFQIAGPTLELVNEPIAEKKPLPPLVETAHFSFDGSLDEDAGKTSPEKAEKTSFAPGFKGQAVTVADGGALSYPLGDLLKPESGAMAAWIKTTKDPMPTFAPVDQVALKILGENELGKKQRVRESRNRGPAHQGLLWQRMAALHLDLGQAGWPARIPRRAAVARLQSGRRLLQAPGRREVQDHRPPHRHRQGSRGEGVLRRASSLQPPADQERGPIALRGLRARLPRTPRLRGNRRQWQALPGQTPQEGLARPG